MKKFKPVHAIFLIFIISFFFVQCSNTRKIREAMSKEAELINAQCPVMLNEVTRLDKCEVLSPKTFRYNYTMLSLTPNTTDTVKLKNDIESGMTKSIKEQVSMEPYLKEGIVCQYFYRDLSGNYLFQINIGTNEYNN